MDFEDNTTVQMVDLITNVNVQTFRNCVGDMNVAMLRKRIAELDLVIEMSQTQFSSIELSILTSNVFPYLKRTDWNNLSVVNKEIHKEVKENDALTPPWPEIKLSNDPKKKSIVFTDVFTEWKVNC